MWTSPSDLQLWSSLSLDMDSSCHCDQTWARAWTPPGGSEMLSQSCDVSTCRRMEALVLAGWTLLDQSSEPLIFFLFSFSGHSVSDWNQLAWGRINGVCNGYNWLHCYFLSWNSTKSGGLLFHAPFSFYGANSSLSISHPSCYFLNLLLQATWCTKHLPFCPYCWWTAMWQISCGEVTLN